MGGSEAGGNLGSDGGVHVRMQFDDHVAACQGAGNVGPQYLQFGALASHKTSVRPEARRPKSAGTHSPSKVTRESTPLAPAVSAHRRRASSISKANTCVRGKSRANPAT